MIGGKKVTAIVLVAGNSTRFGANRNKNFELINEKTVLAYSLQSFDKNEYIDDIIVAAREADFEIINNILNKEQLTKKTTMILGGSSRKESVYNCIKNTNSDIVLIHDGARPVIKQEYINNCVESMKEFKGVTIGVKAKDTIKIADENNIVITTTERKKTWLIQTPQCFERETLLKVHEKYMNEDVTDDCELLEKENLQVKIIEGDYTNIKITTSEDLEIVNKFVQHEVLDEASQIIKNGGIVLFPTETVYGIGANAFDDEAVKKIFVAKGRAQDNPLILHISDMKMLEEIAENISNLELKLMETFWPGPFTIILNKKSNIANQATCNGDTVGVRMPSNRIAYELIKRANIPIAAPSANISGRPSGTNVNDIFEELKDRVDYIINGGDSEIGLESTVVRVINNEVKILRPGKITKEDILKVAERVEVDKKLMEHVENDEKVLSPGMKYRHYAPKTHCKLVYSENNEKRVNEILKIARENKNVIILSTAENIMNFKEFNCINIGSSKNLLDISHNLFSILRSIDKYNAELAIIEGVTSDGVGLAIMNRLIRACEYDFIRC